MWKRRQNKCKTSRIFLEFLNLAIVSFRKKNVYLGNFTINQCQENKIANFNNNNKKNTRKIWFRSTKKCRQIIRDKLIPLKKHLISISLPDTPTTPQLFIIVLAYIMILCSVMYRESIGNVPDKLTLSRTVNWSSMLLTKYTRVKL